MIVPIGSYPTFRLCYKSLYINKNPGLNFCFHWTVPRFPCICSELKFGFKLLSALDNSPLSLRFKN